MTDYVAVTCDFLVLHKYATLVEAVCIIDSVAFLVTMSRGIKFVAVDFIRTRNAKQFSKSLKIVIKLYTRGSMKVQTILMDIEFDKIINNLMDNVVVKNSSAKEHVADI